MSKHFVEMNDIPLLLIDADPDQNLAEMMGIDLRITGKHTISEILFDLLGQGGTVAGISPQNRIEGEIWSRGIYEGASFDLIAIGTKWREGCYDIPNNVLKKLIPEMTVHYQHTVIDSQAGLAS